MMNCRQSRTQVGCSFVELNDHSCGAKFPMLVMYPCDAPEKRERIGPYEIDFATDAVPRNEPAPLVLISHGTGGSHLVYRTLAHHLASCGFVVGMLEHPHNNRNDNSLENTIDNLRNRPAHLRTAIDWLFGHAQFGPYLKSDSVAVIGHSMGGYTALALAGGLPTCLPHESADGRTQRVDVITDARVKALVLLAPATVWFREDGALSAVRQPILMMVGEKDQYTPGELHAQLVLDGVPDRSKVQYREIENGGHFSFLSPFPAAMINPAFPPSQDPAGFDRTHFQEELHRDVADFLARQLAVNDAG